MAEPQFVCIVMHHVKECRAPGAAQVAAAAGTAERCMVEPATVAYWAFPGLLIGTLILLHTPPIVIIIERSQPTAPR